MGAGVPSGRGAGKCLLIADIRMSGNGLGRSFIADHRGRDGASPGTGRLQGRRRPPAMGLCRAAPEGYLLGGCFFFLGTWLS